MPRPDLYRDFFASLADPSLITDIFNHLPDVFFFVKNRDCLLISGSQNLLERLGAKNARDIAGRPDSDFFPEHVVKAFHIDDQLVFRTGKPLINRLEIWYDEQRTLSWFLTTKVPLRGKDGKIVGLMGITRRDANRSTYEAESGIATITAYVRKHCDRILTTAQLARACGVSERTLFRKVRQALNITPYELMLRIRVQKAAEALIPSADSILTIAIDHGFCDQSTFTQHFRKRLGMTPKQFRVRHRQPAG
ncbi:MAG: helix-turn-helix domain-containing protein [Prosthecobacter sp.]|uniref:AraC family transcriptional regulator n=1 Tax=Prosthecobacter sp. TaxID=1965333 RepID=UPI0038FE0C1E